MRDEEITEPIADMLVRCGIQRGVLGRIDADNVARILLPVVREIADQRAADELAAAAKTLDDPVSASRLYARAAALRGGAGRRSDEAHVSDDGVHFGDYR